MRTNFSFRRRWLAAIALAWITAHTLLIHHWLPAVFIALTLFALGVAGARRRREAFAFAFGGGWLLFMGGQYFLGLYSWPGLALLATWQAATLVPAALGLRWLQGHWHWPLAFALPMVWVGGEYLRNIGPPALPTGMLSGPCCEHLWMIQVCDLAGVYGLDFALAMVNGLLADAALAWWAWRNCRSRREEGFEVQSLKSKVQSLTVPLAITASVWLFIPVYGWHRLFEAERTMRLGPVLAVVQPDVPFRSGIEHGFDPGLFLQEMMARSDEALGQRPPPQLLVWPEAMSTMPPLNAELLTAAAPLPGSLAAARAMGRETLGLLRPWVERNGVPLLLGSLVWLPSPTNSAHWVCYNGGLTVSSGAAGDAPRQLKMRLFPGGEQIPGRGTFVQGWLRRLIEWSGQIRPRGDMEAGERREIFRSESGSARYIITICYEMLFADSSGAFLSSPEGGKPFDFMVNISNDGVFQRSRGQLVHWRVAPFRAVESRTAIARAANTGISAFVKSTGEIYGAVTNEQGQIWTGRGAPELSLIADVVRRREKEAELLRHPEEYQRLTNDIARIQALRREAGVSGQSTQPVYLDTRTTWYSRTGDWFAKLLLGFMAAAALAGIMPSCSGRRPRNAGCA